MFGAWPLSWFSRWLVCLVQHRTTLHHAHTFLILHSSSTLLFTVPKLASFFFEILEISQSVNAWVHSLLSYRKNSTMNGPNVTIYFRFVQYSTALLENCSSLVTEALKQSNNYMLCCICLKIGLAGKLYVAKNTKRVL